LKCGNLCCGVGSVVRGWYGISLLADAAVPDTGYRHLPECGALCVGVPDLAHCTGAAKYCYELMRPRSKEKRYYFVGTGTRFSICESYDVLYSTF